MSPCYRAIKYRVYPTDEQKEFFMDTFHCCRFLWNQLLEKKRKHNERIAGLADLENRLRKGNRS